MRLCENAEFTQGKSRIQPGFKANLIKTRIYRDSYPCNIPINSWVPTILIARFMLYTKKCNRDSVLTLSVLLVRKYENPKALLMVPKGCSTVCFRVLYISENSSVLRSTSSAIRWNGLSCINLPFSPLLHLSFTGQLEHASKFWYLLMSFASVYSFLWLYAFNKWPWGQI